MDDLQEDSWHEFTSEGPGQEGIRAGDWGFMKGCKVMEVAARRVDLPGVKPDEARGLLIDFVGYFFDRYFKGGRSTTLPIDWQELPFGEHTVFARGWQRNMQLEEAADRLLAGETVDEFLSARERAQRSNGSAQ